MSVKKEASGRRSVQVDPFGVLADGLTSKNSRGERI
jgi:hypothetical protein